MKCEEFKKLEWKEKESKVQEAHEHVNQCAECMLFKQEYDGIIGSLQNESTHSLNLYQAIQNNLKESKNKVIPFRERVALRISFSNVKWTLPVAATIIVCAVLALHVFFMPSQETSVRTSLNYTYVNQVNLKDTPEGLLVSWHNAQKSEYTLCRSINPRDFSNAKMIKVKGNSYLDKEAANYPIVYYKVM